MNKKVKKALTIKFIQLFIYVISVAGAFLNREFSPMWPIYLSLLGVFLGNFIPIQFRTGFFSKDPGLLLKNHTRGLENIIEMAIFCISFSLIQILNIFG